MLADIEGSGAIQHIWLTPTGGWRNQILRMYWDDDPQPAVECPVGDFFACGWGEYAQVSSLAVCVNPGTRVQLLLGDAVPAACAHHAHERGRRASARSTTRSTTRCATCPTTPRASARSSGASTRCPKGDVVTILDGVQGRGQYVGTYCAWGVNNRGWWGEGEVKFFIDGDGEFPTICGTGTEDYFCGSYNFDVGGQYTRVHDAVRGHAAGAAPRRHVPVAAALRPVPLAPHRPDPLPDRPRVTMQALGWRRGGRYLQLQDDIATVAYWYQTLPIAPFPRCRTGTHARSSDATARRPDRLEVVVRG